MENPNKRIQTLAREIGVGVIAMKLALNEDFRYHLYKRPKGRILMAQVNCLMKGKKLLNKLSYPVKSRMIWFFYQNQLHNTKNDGWLAYNPCGVPCIMKTKFLQNVMVFGCASSEADVMSYPTYLKRASCEASGE